MNDVKYPLYRDELFSKAKMLSDYEKLKTLHQSVCKMLEHVDGKIETHGNPRNPRQDILQRLDRNNLRVLKQRRIRIEERLRAYERDIQLDIERSKNEL